MKSAARRWAETASALALAAEEVQREATVAAKKAVKRVEWVVAVKIALEAEAEAAWKKLARTEWEAEKARASWETQTLETWEAARAARKTTVVYSDTKRATASDVTRWADRVWAADRKMNPVEISF